MTPQASLTAIESLAGQGEFASALELLRREERSLRSADFLSWAALGAELREHCGDGLAAAALAADTLPHAVGVPSIEARLLHVLGIVAFDQGDYTESFGLIQRSITAAQAAKSNQLIAKAKLSLLGRFFDSANRSLNVEALFPDVRRSVARAADPHLLVGLRLALAKFELARQGADETRRHLSASANLLCDYPNLWLEGRVELGYSVLANLLGNPEDAVSHARSAISLARRSGHARTELAGLVNLSHALHATGEFAEACRCSQTVLSRTGSDIELRLCALDTLANVRISQGNLASADQAVAEMLALLERENVALRSQWLEFNALQTRIRLLHAQQRWLEADVLLGELETVRSGSETDLWETSFRMSRLRGVVALRRLPDTESIATLSETEMQSVRAVCERAAVLALSQAGVGRTTDGQRQFHRALRLGTAIHHAGLHADLAASGALFDSLCEKSGDSGDLPVSPDLDSAVALLELGAYTHVLGPEALAVVDGAGCATAAALVATGPSGPRIVDARGWDERAALAAARRKDGVEVIPLGDHRDEAWELIVEPRPELEHRATLIAIRKIVGTALSLERYRRDEKQRAALWPTETLDADAGTIWASEQTAELLTIARRIAPTPLSVLLTGETGTGKEMLAHAIHRASDRASRTFLPFNCTAVPRDMLDSQLFGYRKGAFTGADASFPGVIRSAAGGTLFLDEIAEMGPDIQPKLLRFLETHEIHPIGEPHPIVVDVRVIAATNANLERLVAEGRFREDLFYRLNVVRLALPPLRERREEIPPLVQHYLERFGHEQKKGRLTITDDTLEYLLLYSWPGNVRQLANEVRRMIAMAEPGAALTPAVLSPEIQASRRTIPAGPPGPPEARVPLEQPLPAAVEALERTMVRHALNRAQGRVEEAARLLGISRKGLFLKRRRWGLSPAADRVEARPPAPASPAGCA